MELAALGFRFALASLFLLAGLTKVPRVREFERVVGAYGLIPPTLVRPLARSLPVCEVAVGVLLAVGLGVRAVAALTAAVLLVFTCAVSVNLLRGRDIDCGCFSVVTPRRITWWTVARNLVLFAFGLALAWNAPTALSVDAVFYGQDGNVTNADATAVLVATTLALAGVALASAAFRLRRIAATAAANS